MGLVSFAIAAGLASIHLFSGTLPLRKIPHRHWISMAGGVSIAYIFLDIFPEMGQAQQEIEATAHEFPSAIAQYLEHHVYLLALAGLVVFYGLEIWVWRSRSHNRQHQGKDHSTSLGFWIHISGFAIYNGILGYLFHEIETQRWLNGLLFFVAIAPHFLVNDRNLRDHHRHAYIHIGRWLLTGTVLLGWTMGQIIHLDSAAIAVVWAFIAGGIILNVLKEELPDERDNCYLSFVAGASLYGLLLLIALPE